jgi:patatin-like phospholipase/acyl hydrolase
MERKVFKILSIDGGGTRGVYPSRLLCELEEELSRSGKDSRLCNYFDLICGTSTGGIIAVGIALGMPALEILNLYKDNAAAIFKKKPFRLGIFHSKYSSDFLRDLLKETFSRYSTSGDTRLGHAKTRVCIPTYNAVFGKAHVYKTAHHDKLFRDYQIPAHHVALSTAAAPVFFPPYSFTYTPIGSANSVEVNMNIDGGVIANNPTHIGIVEAHNTLGVPLADIRVLSLGTGHKVFTEHKSGKGFGFWYWGNKKVRLLDLMFSAQSQNTDNLIKFLNNGVGEGEEPKFYYKRIQHHFGKGEDIGLDETDPQKLKKLETIALNSYKEHGAEIWKQFLVETKRDFEPVKQLS